MQQIKISRTMHYPDVIINTNSDKLIEQISMLYSGFTSYSKTDAHTLNQQINSEHYSGDCIEITIEHTIDGVTILKYNNQVLETDNPMQDIEERMYKSIHIQEGIFALHAAAVEYKEKAYALTAATATGKTTLTSYLIHNGFNYITDDCVLINMSDLSVYPYCKSVHLRDGGLKVLKSYGISPQGMYHLNNKIIERYIFSPSNCIFQPVTLGGILFITRSEQENSVFDISHSERIDMLMRSPITDYRVTSDYLKFLLQLSKINCKKVIYKDMEFIRDYIKNEACNAR